MSTGQISILDRPLYTQLHRASSAVLLGLLWTLVALPIVTAVPATAALLAVVRERHERPDLPVIRRFMAHLRALFVESLMLGIAFLSASAVVLSNVVIAVQLGGQVGPMLIAAAMVPAVLILGTTLNYLVLLVNYESAWRDRIRTATALTLGRPACTITAVALVSAAAVGTYYVPVLIVVAGTTLASLLLRVITRGLSEFAVPRTGGGMA